MIRAIKLTNFKCFEELDLKCAPLTLLCGVNGMGKSSVIQALLVLRQSHISGDLSKGRLTLSGELADLGTGEDVLFEDAKEDAIRFELCHKTLEPPCRLSFHYVSAADKLETITDDLFTPLERNIPRQWVTVPPFSDGTFYISADRLGPQKLYVFSETLARRDDLGAQGIYSLNYLIAHGDDLFDPSDPRCVGSHARRFSATVEHWLREVGPGAHINLAQIPEADALVAGFSFDRPDDIETRSYRATNVGFGLSYVLPVLIAMLAPKGSLCLIENPEAHLHPRGQTALAELAVRASIAGVQVIVETHSDHFMDGVRIAVREGLVEPNQVALHYFERENGRAVVTSPQIDSDGRLSSWPSGFFDQQDENLAKLLAPKP